MADEPRESDYPLRDWQPARFSDWQFSGFIPAVKWGYFAERVRPLADEAAETVWAALFAGVIRPFHYLLAAGWMGKLFQRLRSKPSRPSDIRRGQTVEEALKSTLEWNAAAPVFLVDSSKAVYVAGWADLLDCHRRGWLPDTFVFCTEASSRVALFWEGCGPYFADRGERCLMRRKS